MQPDVLAARFDELTDKNLPAAPVLAVEVLSPGGRLIDLDLKRAHYQRLGTPSYWVLDPDISDLLVLDLDAEANSRRWSGVDDEVFEAQRPFPVEWCRACCWVGCVRRPAYPGRAEPRPPCWLRNVHISEAVVGHPPVGQACPRPE